MKRILILICLANLFSLAGRAQDFNYYPDVFLQRWNSAVIAGHSGSTYNDSLPATMHDRWNDEVATGGHPTGYSFKSVQDFIKVGINHDTSIHVSAYKYAVSLQIDCFSPTMPGPTPVTTFNVVLNISYDPDSLKTYNDLAVYKLSSYQKIQVIITDIKDISGTPTTVPRSSLAKNFYVESDVAVERYDNIAASSFALVSGSSYSPGSLNVSWAWATSSYCHLSSVPPGSIVPVKPVLYELEWTYIDDYQYNLATGGLSYAFPGYGTVNYDFRKNSTRIQTGNLSYAIPLIYEHGAIIYRIRYLQPDPTSYQTPVYSAWSLPDVGSISISGGCFDANGYIITTPHSNDSLNWQYTVSFAEDGKYKNVVNYFDGLLKERQTQTKFNTDPNDIIVADKVYDYEGHPSLQTLPTPVVQSGPGYRKDISVNAYTGHPYKAADFDYLGCSLPDSIPPLNSASQANIYYSSLNPNKTGQERYVPSAGGYPFSETLYSPENANKVAWQGGVGINEQLWKNHGTHYEYMDAQQKEIDQLMGSEAGYYNFYPKQVVTDPNGQTSFSVYNSAGKIVVSGLVGDPDTANEPVDTLLNYVRGDTTCSNVLADITQQKLSDRLTAEHSFYADKAGSNHLQYSVKIPAYSTGCGTNYLWATANYNVVVSTDCGVPVMTLAGTIGKDSTLSSNVAEYGKSNPKDTLLPKAKYVIHKDLIFDKFAINNDVKGFVSAHEPSCYHDSLYFIRNTVDSAGFPCQDSALMSACDIRKQQMLRDLYPGGKYAQYFTNSDGSFARGDSNSIFTRLVVATNDVMPINDTEYRFQSPCLTLPNVTYQGRTYSFVKNLPIDTFIKIFNDTIAEALLPLHPEYCLLQSCDDGSFEKLLDGLVTYQQAQAANMFILDSIINKDPLYLDAPAAAKANVYNGLSHFKTLTSDKIDKITLENVYCAAGNSQEQMHCQAYLYQNEINNFIFINNDIKQQYFEQLKMAYIANRAFLLQEKYANRDTSCSICGTGLVGRGSIMPVMMHVTGNPVFSTVLDSNGNVATNALPDWMKHLFNSADSGTLTATSAPTGLTDSMSTISTNLVNGQLDAIMARMANCSLNAMDLSGIRTSIGIFCGSCTVITPGMVNSALSSYGIPPNDLCNPFIAPYDSFDPTVNEQQNYLCGNPALYTGMENFLNISGVKSAIVNAASHTAYTFTMTPSTNPFEKQIYQYWNDSNITATAYINSITSTYGTSSGTVTFIDLKLKPSYATTDSFDIYIKPELTTYKDLTAPSSTYTATNGFCINNDSLAATSGYATKNTAVFDANVTLSSTVYPGQYLLWSRKINFMDENYTNTIANCITCLDIKNAVNSFVTDAATYKYDIHYNHPLFEQALTNYLNYTLKKQYTFDDYDNLMKGCALSDKILFPDYHTLMETVSSSDALADNIVNTFKSLTPRNLVQQRLKIGTQTVLLLDFSTIPEDSLLYFKNLVINNIGSNGGYYYQVMDSSYVFSKTSLCVDTFNKLSAAGTVTSSAIQIQENGNYENYTMYHISTAGGALPHAKADSVIQVFVQTCPGSQALYSSQLLRSDDYATTDKQNYLNYVYALNPATHADLVDSISAANLQIRLAGMSSKATSYDDPYCSAKKTDFYFYTSNQSTYPGYALMYNNIIQPVMTFMGSSKIFPDNISTSVAANLKVYRKANGYYWYRYFDATNHLYNVYINPPANPGLNLSSFHLDSMRVGSGKDSIRSLIAYVSTAPGVNVYACKGYTDFTIGYGKQLANVILEGDPTNVCADTFDCEYNVLQGAIFAGNQLYRQYFDSVTDDVTGRMISYYVQNALDTLNLCTGEQKYQSTVYYYDQAGNLEKTVPPGGVVQLSNAALPTVASSRNSNTIVAGALPAHTKVSYYQYNAKNQLVYQKTPDGGTTYFFYDAAGRQMFSQNSQQRSQGNYSYTLYDKQGRQVETGQIKLGCNLSGTIDSLGGFDTTHCSFTINGTTVSSIHPPYVQYCNNEALYPLDTIIKYIRTQFRSDVVETTYDTMTTDLGAIAGYNLSTQENLRKRVSAIRYYSTRSPNYYAYQLGYKPDPLIGIYYSYDMGGNVKTVSYDYSPFSDVNQRYKRVDYDYDMLSGKINMISYNRGRRDQFYQRYDYDADNRITTAYTSNDGVIWNTDAQYAYYKYGPLASVKIGDAKLQSIEYAYTIQGWLKAMNGDVLRTDKDMGSNGATGDLTYARDVVAHALDYFKNDYQPIDNTASISDFGQPAKSLYNGNIVRQTTDIAGLGNMQRTYRYDQLQRLKQATYATINDATLAVASPSNIYANTYRYDPDGNILGLTRYDGSGTLIDNLTYNYPSGNVNNRLQYVSDAMTTSTGTDIKSGQAAGNYAYDNIGNLKSDKQGAIGMTWTPYGKVKQIVDTAHNEINFTYDGLGNRVYKDVVHKIDASHEDHKGEYYVHDATGNILAVYKTHSNYAPISLIASWDALVSSETSFKTFIATEVAGPYPTFSTSFQSNVIGDAASWCTTTTDAQPVSYYLMQADVLNRMLYSNNTYFDPLRSFSNTNNMNIYGVAMDKSATQVEPLLTSVLLTPAAHQLLVHYDHIMPLQLTTAMWQSFGLQHTPDSNVNATNLVNVMNSQHLQDGVAGQMYTNILTDKKNHNTNGMTFYIATINDNSIFDSQYLRGQGSQFEYDMAGLLYNFSNRPFVYSFYDQWSSARGILNGVTSLDERFGWVYNSNVANTIGSYLTSVNGSDIDNAIASIPELTTGAYYNLLTSYGDYETTISVATLPTGVVADTVALAEHHIYGSSRLGIQHYDTTGYRNTFNQNSGVTRLTNLSDTLPWYNYNYEDLVDKNQKTPYGHGDLSAFTTTRTVGLRYYELTDHLGNVLATVLDRKYGHLPSGATSYDYWNASLGTVTDYYPGGMVMPGRYKQAGVDSNSYRFGFNGQQKDNEVYGFGNLNGAKFWEYGTREERRWNRDEWNLNPSISPYAVLDNNPILKTDPLGNVPNEYDENGNKISDLGGDKVDFYHQKNGDTKIVDKKNGATSTITGGENIIRGYTLRDKNTSWGDVTGEFFLQQGPTNSLFADFDNSNEGPFESLHSPSSSYSNLARISSLNSTNQKGFVNMTYGNANPLAAQDMWEQMWGRSRVNWYKLGDQTLFLMTDAKSATSALYRASPSWERTPLTMMGNTRQTYIWLENNKDIKTKVWQANYNGLQQLKQLMYETKSLSPSKF